MYINENNYIQPQPVCNKPNRLRVSLTTEPKITFNTK